MASRQKSPPLHANAQGIKWSLLFSPFTGATFPFNDIKYSNTIKPLQVMLPLLLREEKLGARPGGLWALLLALCFPQSWDLLRASEGNQ